ncbi:MAG: outer membrane protein assembly factor [Gemmatimonadetes bacterium]|nr:outer membrane protein assembly factor [Gemmatimonadota bacterium]
MLRPRLFPSPAALILCGLSTVVVPIAASAQRDSAVVVAGPEYRAGPLHSALLGSDYRDLWTVPTRVPVLDLSRYMGGLTPTQRGSGKQTRSLRFKAGDGREYNFRSVNKDQTGGLHPDFQETLIDWFAQDQVSSKHPAAALISHVLLEAAGVLHPTPVLFRMPDDPRLGEFRSEFAGMLGTIEIHANEVEGGRAFAGASKISGTENLLEDVEESPEDRVDSREFLKARLMDLLMGDWDRHIGQWRWAAFEREGIRRWVPVPEDRDNAFSDYDGLLLGFARGRATNLVRFRERYPNLFGLTANAQPLDRPLLSDLPVQVFDSLGLELQRRLTDAVIDRAVAQTPPEHFQLRGPELVRKLRARRDGLPQMARRFYHHLARDVDVRATDVSELAVIDRMPDGTVDVRLYAAPNDRPAPQPYFQRRFLSSDTREVRVYLQGGNDRAVIRGAASVTPMVRVIGGGGDDVLMDSSTVGGGRPRSALYDDRGENVFVRTPATVVDTRQYQEADSTISGFNENAPPQRDWGTEAVWFQPRLAWRYNAGPVIGGGPIFTRYGFRREPYARRTALTGLWAPAAGRFALELNMDVQRTNSRSRMSVLAHASQLETVRFHGYGNETPGDGPADLYKVRRTDYLVQPIYHAALDAGFELFFGPVLQYDRPELPPGGPADVQRPLGSDAYGAIGGQLGGLLDRRDAPAFPRSGFMALVRGSAFPAALSTSSFGGLDGLASAYVPIPLPIETTLAARAGGRMVLGTAPLQHAAYVGGPETIRGLPRQRYAGDSSLFGTVELRSYLTRFNFISRGDLGVIALADAGRVFVDGESSNTWHTGVGGGLWFGILDRTRTFSIVFAHGQENAVYFAAGMPF